MGDPLRAFRAAYLRRPLSVGRHSAGIRRGRLLRSQSRFALGSSRGQSLFGTWDLWHQTASPEQRHFSPTVTHGEVGPDFTPAAQRTQVTASMQCSWGLSNFGRTA